MAEYKGYQGPMRIPAQANASWGGKITVDHSASTDSFTFTNTYIMNSNAIVLFSPANGTASNWDSSAPIYVEGITDNGTLTVGHATSPTGSGEYYFVVFQGPGTALSD